MIRDEAQEEVVDLYCRTLPQKAAAVLSTGFGKSKVVIDIIKRLKFQKVVILVNSTLLRDHNWKEQFEQWDYLDFYNNNVEMATYQAAYKWNPLEKDLTGVFLVADEVDFAAGTEELSKVFYNYPSVRMLGVTGFITDNKLDWFKRNMPIITRYSANDARENKLLNDIHFIFVQYELSHNKSDNIVEYTSGGQKKSFMQSDNNAYSYHEKQILIARIKNSENRRNFEVGDITYEQYVKIESTNNYTIKRHTMERNDILMNSKSSVKMTKKLLDWISSNVPDHKTVVFSKRTSQSELICGLDNVYNKAIDNKKAKENFDNFKSGISRLLGTCDKINRGANIPDLNVGIFETFFGSDTKAAQRLGRLMRLDPEKKAYAFILLPYYVKSHKDKPNTLEETQQVKWARNMLKKTIVKHSTVWNYCAITPNKK